MRFRLALIGTLCIPPLIWFQPIASAEQKADQPQKKPPAKKSVASLTGCVDEQDGQYVLIHDRTRDPIANLEADGFPPEGFARHLGHKVTVRGSASSNDGPRPVFKVRSVETISETCEPGLD